jgi:exodeoxyribonuclease V gamma subunit
MSLHILHSNRVEKLLENLSRQIATPHPGAGFLQGETILLDNRVLGKWLNLKLAAANSVAANIRYVQVAELFWELARTLVSADISEQTHMSKEEMTWRLMALLEDRDVLGHEDLKPVRAYLSANSESDRFTGLKRYQLAASVADLFDQYLVYRPDWINRTWDRDLNIHARQTALWKTAEAWQKVLWHKMVAGLDNAESLHHRAAIQQRLLSVLEGDFDKELLKFHRLFIFGITSMPEAQLDLLMLLGKHIEINLYVLNPCEHEWFDIRSEKQIIRLEQRLKKSDERKTECRKRDLHPELDFMEVGNPLLAGQAAQVQEFIELIYQKTDQYQLHAGVEDFDDFEDPGTATLLGSIQKEVLELQYRGEVAQLESTEGHKRLIPAQEFSPADNQFQSIHIHNCHSPQREVEVLHDQLLDMFNRDKNLKPRDVVVMMPKVAPYVPFISAVFEGAAREQRIRYHISDRTLQEESPILNSFETLLKIPDSRLPLSEVLGLLEVPAIHRRFGLDREAYEQLKSWLIACGARWGLDATHRSETGLPPYSDFSWDFGMNRLLAGYAMQAVSDAAGAGEMTGLLEMTSSEEAGAAYKILPMDEVEGGGADVLDSFLRFWNVLKTQRKQLRRSRKPMEWKSLLEKLIDDFYQAEDEDWRALNELRRGFETLELAGDETNGWYQGHIAPDVIRAMLQPVLKQPGSMRHPWGEGVKFCSLLPMRGVPFKVIYLLGMNMDDYPRRVTTRSFDLMRGNYQPGDRSARTDDRWLFLEALLSARKAFHVSYTGQDMHRNEKREPSVVLAELIDYIRDGYALPADAGVDWPFRKKALDGDSFLYTRHPLQPYNPQYFQTCEEAGPSRLVSYQQQAYEVASGQLKTRESPPSAGDTRWESSALPAHGEVIDVNLGEFVMFFTRPYDWFFRKRGVGLNRYNDTVEDEELFELQQGLGSWKLRNLLINQASHSVPPHNLEREIDHLVARQKASGNWPMGEAAGKEISNLNALPPEYVFFLSGRQPLVEPIDLPLDLNLETEGASEPRLVTLRVNGALRRYEDEFIIHSASKTSDKYLLEFYIQLALAGACEDFGMSSAHAVFLNYNKTRIADSHKMMGVKVPLQFDHDFVADEPRHQNLLKHLAGLYLQYRETAFPFLPSLSMNLSDDKDELAAMIDDGWHGDRNSVGIRDEMQQRAYYGSPAALQSETFVAVAESLQLALQDWLSIGGRA